MTATHSRIPPRLWRRAALAVALGAVLLLAACGSSDDASKDNAPVAPVETLYNNEVDALNGHRYTSAIDQFNLVEQNYPYSTWAPNAQLMSAYAQYMQNHYTEAISALDRYVQLHPAGRDTAYAYYLRALCYYEQITDISRDQKGTQDAMAALQQVVNRYPDRWKSAAGT
jgi:outer membrane protein assembly factor BamD